MAPPPGGRIGQPCKIAPYDADADVDVMAGDFVLTAAGSAYLVRNVREVNRREPIPGTRRWALGCVRVERADIGPDDVVHPLYWYPRDGRA